jgi:hypothetical protein
MLGRTGQAVYPRTMTTRHCHEVRGQEAARTRRSRPSSTTNRSVTRYAPKNARVQRSRIQKRFYEAQSRAGHITPDGTRFASPQRRLAALLVDFVADFFATFFVDFFAVFLFAAFFAALRFRARAARAFTRFWASFARACGESGRRFFTTFLAAVFAVFAAALCAVAGIRPTGTVGTPRTINDLQ